MKRRVILKPGTAARMAAERAAEQLRSARQSKLELERLAARDGASSIWPGLLEEHVERWAARGVTL